jgi:hypothetical protein
LTEEKLFPGRDGDGDGDDGDDGDEDDEGSTPE